METDVEQFKRALAWHSSDFSVELTLADIDRLANFYQLLVKWNPRLHLVAPCSSEEFAVRHMLESLLLLKHLPANARVADVGTGAGLPIVPCLLVRDDVQGVLIESSPRKCVFLREALRSSQSAERSRVIASRFEDIGAPEVDFLTCRALDRFAELLPKIVAWAPRHTKFLLFTGEATRVQIEAVLAVDAIERIPHSEKRFLIAASQLRRFRT